MPRNTFTFVDTPYALDAVKLGSLVPDKYQPDQDAVSVQEAPTPAVARTEDQNFRAHMGGQSSSSFKAALTKLFSFNLSSRSDNDYEISSNKAYHYMLKQPREVFQQICQDPEVQLILERDAQMGDSWHFVVGYKTLVDGRLAEAKSQGTEAGLTGSAPIGTAAGLDPSAAMIMDGEMAWTHSSDKAKDDSFQAVGERVYSVCYRRVRLEFKSGEILAERSKMDARNVWHSYTTPRAATAVQKSVEASLEEAEFVEDADGEEKGAVLLQDEDEVFIVLACQD